MIDSLLDNLKGGAMGELMEKFGLDEKKAETVVKEAGSSTQNVMSDKIAKGNLDNVMSLFSNKPNGEKENSMLGSVQDDFIGKITSKLGLDPAMAKNISDTILPKLTSMITNKNEETPASDTSSIMDMFGGKGMDSIKDVVSDKLKGFF